MIVFAAVTFRDARFLLFASCWLRVYCFLENGNDPTTWHNRNACSFRLLL